MTQTVEPQEKQKNVMGRFNVWDTPWFNIRLISGVMILVLILLMGVIGPLLYDTDKASPRSGRPRQAPVGFTECTWEKPEQWNNPLGTDNLGTRYSLL